MTNQELPMDDLVTGGTELTQLSPQRLSQIEINSQISDATFAIGWTGYDDVDGQDRIQDKKSASDEVDGPPTLIWNGMYTLNKKNT